jgi:hypothetical protein
MPWKIAKDSRCPASKPYGVVGGSTGNRLAGCHPTEEAAKKQQAALYVHAPDGRTEGAVAFTTPTTEVW